MPVIVASIHVYPIKGAGGFTPTRWALEERGLRYDRRFVVVDREGDFRTQRELPRLALVSATIDGESLRIGAGGQACSIPLPIGAGDPSTSVRVWDDRVDAIVPSGAADELLSEFLGVDCRLAFMPDGALRRTDERRGEPRRALSFADAAPALLTTESALEELNRRLARAGSEAVPMSRFRPNIVVRGNVLDDDDRWSTFSIGRAAGRCATACKRCQVVTIDQRTAERTGAEPLRTLATYRRDGDAVVFGRHLLIDEPGIISVGDEVIVGFA